SSPTNVERSVSGEWLLEVFLAELAERALSRGARATAGLRPRRRERHAPARRVAADARPPGGPRPLGVRRAWLSLRGPTAAPARARARAVPGSGGRGREVARRRSRRAGPLPGRRPRRGHLGGLLAADRHPRRLRARPALRAARVVARPARGMPRAVPPAATVSPRCAVSTRLWRTPELRSPSSKTPGVPRHVRARGRHRLLGRERLQLHLCHARIVHSRLIGTGAEDLGRAEHLGGERVGERGARVRDTTRRVRLLEIGG